jgi:hypothetical protein
MKRFIRARPACKQCNGFRIIDGGYECPRCQGTGLEPSTS